MPFHSSPDEENDDPYLDAAVRRSMRKHGMPSIQYHESSTVTHGSNDNRWYRPFVVTILSALAVGAIGEAIILYGDVREMRGDIKALKETVEHVFRLVEPHYRGIPEGPSGSS